MSGQKTTWAHEALFVLIMFIVSNVIVGFLYGWSLAMPAHWWAWSPATMAAFWGWTARGWALKDALKVAK